MRYIQQIITTLAAFVVGYATVQIAQGYDTVSIHFSWLAIVQGLAQSGLYVKGVSETLGGKQ